MAELNTDWENGETRGPIKEVISVKLGANVSAGALLEVVSIDANLVPTCTVANGTEYPIGCVLFDGKNGEYAQVLTRGFVKLNKAVMGNVGAGVPIHLQGGKPAARGSGTGVAFGRNMGVSAANGDTGIVAFIDCLGSGGAGVT